MQNINKFMTADKVTLSRVEGSSYIASK